MLSFSDQQAMRNFKNRVNAPTFIHRIINKDSNSFLPGRVNHPEKIVNNIPIDKEIPEDSFNKLNKIKQIELRSSCQGENSDRPTFIIFRLKDNSNDEEKVKQIVSKINKSPNNLLAGYDLGNDNQYRIGVTAKDVWAGRPGYINFWNQLPETIQNSLK